MPRVRKFITGIVLAAATSVAMAQVSGPTPLAWRWAAPTSVSPNGSPTVVGDMVYVAVGSRMFGLDRETGNQKWKYPQADPIDGSFRFGIIVSDGLAISAGDNSMVYAVDAATGAAKWQIQTPAPMAGPPVICGKLLIVPMANNALFAVDTITGTAGWEGPIRIFDGIQGSLGSYKTNVILFNQKNELLSINTTTQKTDWRQRFSNISGDVRPVVFGDNIYVNTGTFLTALNAISGSPRFQKNLSETLVFNPAVSANGIAVVSREGSLFFLDMGGRPIRAKDANNKPLPEKVTLLSAPVAAPTSMGNNYVVPTAEGALNMYDPTNHNLIWAYTIRPYISGLKIKSGNGEEKAVISVPAAGPAVGAGGAMLVLVADGSLLSFDNNFGVDTTAPEVKMPWPSPGSQVNGITLDVVFQIEDEATGVNENLLKIEMNGTPCTYEFGRDGVAVVRFNSFSKNPAMRGGRVTFKVTAVDWLGNRREALFSLFIDNSLKPLGKPADKPGGSGGTGPGKGGGLGGSGGGGLGGGG